MAYQDILMTIQTVAAILSLIISIIALNKITEISNTFFTKTSKSNNRQIAIGKQNEQNMK